MKEIPKEFSDHLKTAKFIHLKAIENYRCLDYILSQPKFHSTYFLMLTVENLYDCLVMDLCKLFLDRKTERNNFHKLFKYLPEDMPDIEKEINYCLMRAQPIMVTFHEERDTRIAHQDSYLDALSIGFDKSKNRLKDFKKVLIQSKSIIELVSDHYLGVTSLDLDGEFPGIWKSIDDTLNLSAI